MAINSNNWWKWLLGAFFAPVTSILTGVTGKDNPVDTVIDGINSAGGYGAYSGGSAASPVPTTIPTPPAGSNAATISDLVPDVPETTTVEAGGSTEDVDTALNDALQGSVSLSDYIKNHPGQTPEQYFEFMANNNDEWAEKWLDYYLEKKGIEEANSYTASREDTAYQRLVSDLRAAGLNPAMMFGGSASTHAAGSISAASPSSGANSASINNYSKMKKLLLAYMMMQIQLALGLSGNFSKAFTSLMGAF